MNKIGSLFTASMQTSSQNTTIFATTSIYTYIQNLVHPHSVCFPLTYMQPLMPDQLSPYPSCRKRFLYSNKKLILTKKEFFSTYSPSGTVGWLLQNTHKIISQETMEIQEVFFSPCFCITKNTSWCKNTVTTSANV